MGGALGSRRQPRVKYVYRLLRPGDIDVALLDKSVYVLWQDDGAWYRAEVIEFSGECEGGEGGAASATIYYVSTQETEECDLAELVADGQIAFSERPALPRLPCLPCRGQHSTLYRMPLQLASPAGQPV